MPETVPLYNFPVRKRTFAQFLPSHFPGTIQGKPESPVGKSQSRVTLLTAFPRGLAPHLGPNPKRVFSSRPDHGSFQQGHTGLENCSLAVFSNAVPLPCNLLRSWNSHERRTTVSAFVLERAPGSFAGVEFPGPAIRFIEEKQEKALGADAKELASLRFSIVITAKWEADGDEDPQRRQELRMELESLRARYFDKIDQIAMAFGVSIAMSVKDEVERRVTLPLSRILEEAAATDLDDFDHSPADI